MKTQLIKKTLAALVLGSLGLMATGVQADGNHEGYGQNQMHGGNDRHGSYDNRAHQGRLAFQQSAVFSQQINARQDRQMDRIRAGMRAGDLTRFEFRELMHEQRRIGAMEQRFLADGIIDPREFQRMDRMLDGASRDIRFEKIDQQARNNHGYNRRFN